MSECGICHLLLEWMSVYILSSAHGKLRQSYGIYLDDVGFLPMGSLKHTIELLSWSRIRTIVYFTLLTNYRNLCSHVSCSTYASMIHTVTISCYVTTYNKHTTNVPTFLKAMHSLPYLIGLITDVPHAGSHTVSFPLSPLSAPGSAPSVLQ